MESEGESQSGSDAWALAGFMKRPLPQIRELKVALIFLVTGRFEVLDPMPGLLMSSLDRSLPLGKWKVLKLDLRKDRTDLIAGRWYRKNLGNERKQPHITPTVISTMLKKLVKDEYSKEGY